MAYVNQEKKAKIAAALKAVMPKDWKYSLAVRNHSTIVLTIRSAPVALLGNVEPTDGYGSQSRERGYTQLNHYHLNQRYDGELLQQMQKIVDALNTDNYDKSDSQSDYFNVGHYVDLNIGKWDKPFVCTAA